MKVLLISLGVVVMLSVVFIAFGAPVPAKNVYYLGANVTTAAVTFSINGFPVDAGTVGQSISSPMISPFLVNGKNTIEVSYAPNAQGDEQSGLTWVIVEKPVADALTKKDGKRLAEGSMKSRVVSLSKLTKQDFTVSRGSIDGDHFFFQRDGRNAVSLGGRLSPAQAFTRLPSRIRYGSLEKPVTKASIHFKKHGTPIDVVFAGLTLPSSQNTVDLPAAAIKSGKQWAKASGFDEILVEGEADKVYGPKLNLIGLSIVELQRAEKDSRVLTLKLPRWHWQDGDRYTKLTEKDTAAISEVIQQYRQAMEAGDAPKQKALLKDQMITQMQCTPVIPKEWQAIFDDLQAERAKAEKLEPMSKSGIRTILVNPQVVRVTMTDGSPVIRIVPKDGMGREYDAFYFSYIGGKWVISI